MGSGRSVVVLLVTVWDGCRSTGVIHGCSNWARTSTSEVLPLDKVKFHKFELVVVPSATDGPFVLPAEAEVVAPNDFYVVVAPPLPVYY